MRVALLGTGKMGAAIARRLAAAGFELVLWNRTRERAEAVGLGTVATTAAEAAAAVEVVLSILFGPEAAREVYGSLHPQPGQVFVEMSTAGPDVLDELAGRLSQAGADLLAAPIVGTTLVIEQSAAMILVGGDLAAFERVRPILQAFGRPEHVGDRRQAAILKLINNAMFGTASLLAAELMAAATRAGVDPEAAFRILSRTMPYLEARRRGYLQHSHENPMFELAGMVKDLELAQDLGHRAGAAVPVVSLARELYALAEPEHGREEMTAVIEIYSK